MRFDYSVTIHRPPPAVYAMLAGPFRLIDGLIARRLRPAIEARLEAIARMLDAAGEQVPSAAPAT
jgi:hypothetical protein